MDIIKELQEEHRSEYEITKKFIDRYPEDKNDWKPHEKSMNMKWLTTHVVEILAWPETILETDYLDFEENPYDQPKITTRKEMQEKLEQDYKKGAEALANLEMKDFDGSWDIRQGDQVWIKWSKYGALRHALNQLTHHRAQLGVYYRLNDIPVPASYGPSADEQ